MRNRLVTDGVVLALAFLGLVALPGSAAGDAPQCQQVDFVTGVCIITVEPPPGTDGAAPVADAPPADTGTGSPCWIDPTRQYASGIPPQAVPCERDGMWWSNAYGCYFRALDPQPDASDPAWAGRDPAAGGAIYECWQPVSDYSVYLWLADPPARSGQGPSPRAVAELAVKQMNLSAIQIGIVPQPGPGSMGIVGMPVWMWAANATPSTVGPVSATASAGGVTVTATAKIHAITWAMGDGSTVTCRGPGTPYDASRGDTTSPDCGHVYTRTSAGQAGGVYTVTATSDWVITWVGAGQTGTIRMGDLVRSVQIAVGEAQVLVTK
ncbi:MAG: hypothetical protein FWF90_09260 [Promicromonosporaceae bacterium]|nr:hypothetical protein [Promicromonosporaceae bacterium]